MTTLTPPTITPTVLDRATLLSRATTLAEKTIFVPQLGGHVTIRELTGRERIDCNEGARTASEEGDTSDTALFNTLVVVAGLVSPQLALADAGVLAEQGKFGAIFDVAVQILALSEARATDLKSGDPAADATE